MSRLPKVDEKIVERVNQVEPGKIFSPTHILMTAPGVSYYRGLTLAGWIGPIQRFPRPRSLANYFGLTPGCHNSGNAQDRLGSITKEGSKIAAVYLGAAGAALLKARSEDARVVSKDQVCVAARRSLAWR